jgi:hypothetical protein
MIGPLANDDRGLGSATLLEGFRESLILCFLPQILRRGGQALHAYYLTSQQRFEPSRIHLKNEVG